MRFTKEELNELLDNAADNYNKTTETNKLNAHSINELITEVRLLKNQVAFHKEESNRYRKAWGRLYAERREREKKQASDAMVEKIFKEGKDH
jgi:cell division septum initiation protein DivIVA